MKVRQTLGALLTAPLLVNAASIQMKDPGSFGCANDYFYNPSQYGCSPCGTNAVQNPETGKSFLTHSNRHFVHVSSRIQES